MSDQYYLNYELLDVIANEQAVSYRTAEPFPHIVIDDFLSSEAVVYLESLFPSLPDGKDQGVSAHLSHKDGSRAQYGKHWVSRELSVDPAFRRLYWELNAAPFVRFLQRLAGIPKLLPDPYLLGGGLHQTGPGGFLEVHADFSRHPDLDLARRLNVLVYLNSEWDESWGGELELWDKEMNERCFSLSPKGGRCVIFNTTCDSFHGHPQPLACPSGCSRKSVALYYYTLDEDNSWVNHPTLWQQTGAVEHES